MAGKDTLLRMIGKAKEYQAVAPAYAELSDPFSSIEACQRQLERWLRCQESILYWLLTGCGRIDVQDIFSAYRGHARTFSSSVSMNTGLAESYLARLDEHIKGSHETIGWSLKEKTSLESKLEKLSKEAKVIKTEPYSDIKDADEYYKAQKEIQRCSCDIRAIESSVSDYRNKRRLLEKSHTETGKYLGRLRIVSYKAHEIEDILDNSLELLRRSPEAPTGSPIRDSIGLCSRLVYEVGGLLKK